MKEPELNAVKMGVLGVSRHYGLRVHLPVSRSPWLKLQAIGSRDAGKARRAAEKWGFESAYGSYQEVVDDPEVEMVYVVLPNHEHSRWIRRCAEAGKAVLCEKPVALNADDAADALDHARSRGILAMEAFMYRFHPQWVRAKELIDAGEIGEVLSIHSVFGYYNTDRKNIRNIKETGGGALYDIGCYTISSARFLLGREPAAVAAKMERSVATGVDVLTSVMMDFGRVQAQFTVGMLMARRQEVQVFGSGGHLNIPLPFNAYPDVPAVLEVTNGVGTRRLPCGPADQYGLLFEAFAGALRAGAPAPTPHRDAVANMRVIDAVFRSAESGLWEPVNPAGGR